MVIRTLTGLPLGQIDMEQESEAIIVPWAWGIAYDYLLLELHTYLWANVLWRIMDMFRILNLLDDDNEYVVPRSLLGVLRLHYCCLHVDVDC